MKGDIMLRHWLIVLIAVLFEVGWVVGLKHAHTPLAWIMTVIAVCFTFYLLLVAGKYLPVGTVYTVFAGLGTAGTVLVGAFVFGESLNAIKIVLLLLLMAGVIGLKMVTPASTETEGDS